MVRFTISSTGAEFDRVVISLSDQSSPAADLPYWEKIATTRSWGRYLSAVERDAILRASQLARPPRRAMDVGCEGGRWSELMAHQGWDMVCTDVDWDTLRVCQRRNPRALCVLVDPKAKTLPLRSQVVNLILCIEVFQVTHSDWFFGEASRVLAPGGLLVGVVRNRISLRGALWELLRLIDRRRRAFPSGVTYRELQKKFSKNGFVLKEAQGYAWFPFARTSNSSLVPFFATLERRLGLRRLVAISPWIVFTLQKVTRTENRRREHRA